MADNVLPEQNFDREIARMTNSANTLQSIAGLAIRTGTPVEVIIESIENVIADLRGVSHTLEEAHPREVEITP